MGEIHQKLSASVFLNATGNYKTLSKFKVNLHLAFQFSGSEAP